MAPEIESRDVQQMAVECVVFDQAERPKWRKLLPLVKLLAPMRPAALPTGNEA